MADWFDFKGTRSTSLGVYVTEFPPIPIAVERAEYKEIPGRAGALTIREGEDVYEDVTFSISCFVRDLSSLEIIAGWLNGSGELVLGNRPDRARKAHVSKQIDITKLLRGRDAHTFDVTFRCDPFWYESVPDVYTLTHSTVIVGEGTIDSEPEIVVYGTGDCTLTVGDKVLTLTGLTGNITIDCARRIAYSGSTSLSHLVAGDWPKMSYEDTSVSWTGNVTSVVITPNWRWL